MSCLAASECTTPDIEHVGFDSTIVIDGKPKHSPVSPGNANHAADKGLGILVVWCVLRRVYGDNRRGDEVPKDPKIGSSTLQYYLGLAANSHVGSSHK